jgi:hypothetical protein
VALLDVQGQDGVHATVEVSSHRSALSSLSVSDAEGGLMRIDTTEARDWMRRNYRHFVVDTRAGQLTRPTNAGLKRMIRDPRTPVEVKQHVYAWLLYRKHRGYAN